MLINKKLFPALFLTLLISLLIISVLPLQVYAATEDGLVMTLEFDETVSNVNVERLTLKDGSGKNNNAEINNPKGKDDAEFPTIKFTEGKFGNALRLNGSQQYFDVKRDVFNNDAITVAFWVNYRGGANWQRFFEIGTAETGEHMMMNPCTDAGKFQISGYNKKESSSFISNPTESSFKFPQNQWTHVAWTMAADGTSTVYINGQAVSMTTIIEKGGATQTVKNKTSFKSPVSFKYVATITGLENPGWFAARFGCAATSTWDSKLLGSFDAVKVYHKALSDEQVKQLHDTNTSIINVGTDTASKESRSTDLQQASKSDAGSLTGGTQASSSASITSSSSASIASSIESETASDTTGTESGSSEASNASESPINKDRNNAGFPSWLMILIILTAAAAGGGILLYIKNKKKA